MRIDGLLVVDKPGGMTSLDVVREIKARFLIKKAGHIGTLDPFATGVLPVAMNEGTKLIPFLQEDPKDYEAVMKIGEETRTDDLTGEIVRRGPWEDLSPEMIRTVFKSFSGKIRQTPPMFSAIKVKGKPLYRMARKGIEIERQEREVQVYDLQVRKIDLPMIHLLFKRDLYPRPGKRYRKTDRMRGSSCLFETDPERSLYSRTGHSDGEAEDPSGG